MSESACAKAEAAWIAKQIVELDRIKAENVALRSFAVGVMSGKMSEAQILSLALLHGLYGLNERETEDATRVEIGPTPLLTGEQT